MYKFLVLIFISLLFQSAKGQDSIHIKNCDSIITVIYKKHTTTYMMAGNKISHRIAIERLKMFESSSNELKRSQKRAQVFRIVFYTSFAVFIAGQIAAGSQPHDQTSSVPITLVFAGLGGFTGSLFIGFNASNHLKKAFELYNKEICSRK